MTERKSHTVARRQRIDIVIKGIKKGDYDDKLGQIQAAVENRQDHKRAQVLAKVFEVYGENYTIVLKDETVSNTSSQKKKPFNIYGPSEDEASSPLETDPPDEELDEKDIESRSPIIGPYDPS
jgi:isopentenyl diphosphate isomerase/L-lactate dehydrogenase-like FMN-dependent dehydrogenase